MNENLRYTDLNGGIGFKIVVDGRETDYAAFVSAIHTECAFNKISSLEIVFANCINREREEFVSDVGEFNVDRSVEVHVGYDDSLQCVFKGKIMKNSIAHRGGVFTITAKHMAEDMTKSRKMRCFEDMTDKDVIESICNEYGIETEVENTEIVHEKMMLYNCSDWDFINIRAEANGMIVYTTPEKLIVKKIAKTSDFEKDATIDLISGYNIKELDVEVDSRHTHRSYNSVSHDASEQELSEIQSDEDDVRKTNEVTKGDENGQIVMTSSQENAHEVGALVNAISIRNDLAYLTGKATIAGYAPLYPADVVRICKVGKMFDGKVKISSVMHSVSAGKWETRVEIGYDSLSFVERYDNVVAPPSLGALPPVSGLQIAKVVQLEGDPAKMGRIYVSLMNLDDARLWCRVATLDAGNKRGSFFMPEVGDEVIVGFIDDNPNQAVVLGMLHSNQSPPPTEITKENHVKGFFSRTGVKLLFDDDKKALLIETPGGNKITVNDDAKVVSMEDQNGNLLKMDDQGITLDGKKAITIKAVNDISVEGTNINIEANAQLAVKGTASAEISSSGNTVVKGGIVQIN